MELTYFESVLTHYTCHWEIEPHYYLWDKGPFEQLTPEFRVLEFPPAGKRRVWVYATCCMSRPKEESPVELHMFASEKDTSLVELLTVAAYFHKTRHRLNLWHTVNFGRPWRLNSPCEHGYISLPYLDGPQLESLPFQKDIIKCYWLIPITKAEVEYKRTQGIDKLEALFETSRFDYLDPHRKSLI